jgi:hypothetical protein
MTVMLWVVVPVPPPDPSTAAPYIVTTVLLVTVGAVHENVQECVLVAEACVISPFSTFVPAPAVNVPAVEATSNPPFPPPPTVRVKLPVAPELIEVGPIQVMAGAAPVLWHIVQVEPFFPE